MYNLTKTGKRIKGIRVSIGMTQQKLAHEIPTSVNTISKVEQGKRGMSIELLVDIATILGVSTDYLLYGKASTLEKTEMLTLLKSQIDELFEIQLN